MKFDWQPATGGIEFDATTTVPGTILNQFSADESGSYLRIATTVHNSMSGNWTSRDENMLFVLQEDDGVFEYVGGLQNLALDESIRSVRFLGDRAFITTFRDVDPLFAIDLYDPAHPEAIGHITIPGFSSYMQLIDQNHLLTVGRNTPYGGSGPTQVALFDISNLLQPRRIAEYTFERFSTSEAELDHHAFGYYADFGLLAMPVSTDRVERVDLDGDGYREASQTVHEFQLAVFSVDVNATNPADRLTLKSEIEHGTRVRRSGFIGDKLYSVADDSVKVVDIAAPGDVVAQLTIPPPAGSGDVVPIWTIDPRYIDVTYAPPTLTDVFPISIDVVWNPTNTLPNLKDVLVPQVEQAEDPLAAAIKQVRNDLVNGLHAADGAPLFLTAEASPTDRGGYSVVFRMQDQNYLYHTNADGSVRLADANFQFSETVGAWHAVAARLAPVPAEPPVPNDPPEVIAPEVGAPDVPVNVIEPQQVLASDPKFERRDVPAPNAAYYFAHLNMRGANASHDRGRDEVFRQISSEPEHSQVLMLTNLKSRSHKDHQAQFDSARLNPEANTRIASFPTLMMRSSQS